MRDVTEGKTDALRIEVFGFDVAEISQIRRIRALIALGHHVHSFTMRRDNMNADFEPDWPNTHLFKTENENLPKRAATVAASIAKMARHRARLQRADMIIARNLDMLAIAWAARGMAGAGRVPLVYECLDINGALCGDGAKSRAMRAAERRLLAGVQMLVVSSPGFMRNYFEPLQGYAGPWALWENKLAAGSPLPTRPQTRSLPASGTPLRLGWVGTIRCAPSLALLAAVADALGDGIEVHIHGIVHHHALPDFDATIASRPNIILHGPYAYPDDLAQIYGDLDVVWAQDLWQTGNNSDWLLPNRIYEASWAGCPSIAVATTETGRRVSDDALGWVVDTPTPAALLDLLGGLDRAEIAARGQALLDRPAQDFVQSADDLTDVIAQVQQARA
ncbi:MAG: glycosyltransferase [Pseudomonadota bacterium]